jgi:signal transduction histidine kinase
MHAQPAMLIPPLGTFALSVAHLRHRGQARAGKSPAHIQLGASPLSRLPARAVRSPSHSRSTGTTPRPERGGHELKPTAPDELKVPEADCDAAQHLRTQFLGSISHEFRTPLAALNASVEFLLEELDGLSREELRQLLASIHFSVTGLQTLIDNLLESTNIEAGRLTIRPKEVDLRPIALEAIQVMKPLLNRRSQQVSLHLADDCRRLEADAVRLRQVIVNLLSNASKFGPVGQTIDIRVEEGPAGMICLSVADQGPGISPRDRGKLFQRFARLDAPDGAQYGIGLGLWVVRTIIEEHGGAVGVEGRPRGGSTFWCTLPRAKESDA